VKEIQRNKETGYRVAKRQSDTNMNKQGEIKKLYEETRRLRERMSKSNTHTHTHTHTQREREREREAQKDKDTKRQGETKTGIKTYKV
jgi:hypothetical protein